MDFRHRCWIGLAHPMSQRISRSRKRRPILLRYTAYVATPHNIKGTSIDRPGIRALGQYVRTHGRHYRQQSRYTICGQFAPETGWYFVSHDRVFDLGSDRQDVLWKFVIPASERRNVMSLLDAFNLNAFSLFGSDEGLMERPAFREIDLKPPG
jgi:hypothetical protein